MNTSLLERCLKELDSDNIRLDYIRGILETLIEMQDVQKPFMTAQNHIPKINIPREEKAFNTPIDEAALLDHRAAMRMVEVKKLSDASTETL